MRETRASSMNNLHFKFLSILLIFLLLFTTSIPSISAVETQQKITNANTNTNGKKGRGGHPKKIKTPNLKSDYNFKNPNYDPPKPKPAYSRREYMTAIGSRRFSSSNKEGKNKEEKLPSQPTTIDLSTLHFPHFSTHLGLGTSKGIPPICTMPKPNVRTPSESHTLLGEYHEDETEIAHIYNTAPGRGTTISEVFTAITAANYRLPSYIHSLYNLPIPPPLPHSTSDIPSNPNPVIQTLYHAIQCIQCSVAKCLSSSVSVEETRISDREVYAHLVLLAGLCGEAGEMGYMEEMLGDCLYLLDHINNTATVTDSDSDSDTMTMNEMTNKEIQDAKIHVLTQLGNIAAKRNNLKSSLRYYTWAFNIRSDNLPLHLHYFVLASNLALGNVREFVRVAGEAQRQFFGNVEDLMGGFKFNSNREFRVDDGSFFRDEDNSNNNNNNNNNNADKGNTKKDFPHPCDPLLNPLLTYISGTTPPQNTFDTTTLAYALHTCLNSTSTSSIQTTFTLDSIMHFRIGRSLWKRGYETLAYEHLSVSASPFQRLGDVHDVYTRVRLPVVFKSFKDQALVTSAFEYELSRVIGEFGEEKGKGKGSNCKFIKDAFDVLPLIRFANDFSSLVVDELGLGLGLTLTVGSEHEHEHEQGYGKGRDLFGLVSALFYAVCPELERYDDIVRRRWDVSSEALLMPDIDIDVPPSQKLTTTVEVNKEAAAEKEVLIEKEDEQDRDKDTQDKIRIGLVASKLNNHDDVLRTHGALLDYLTRPDSPTNHLSVTIAVYPTASDPATKRIQKRLESTRNSAKSINLDGYAGSTLNSADRLLHADLDVIVYLDLPLDARTYALAHGRIAPVQVGMWGDYVFSTGIEESLDYLLLPDVSVFRLNNTPSLGRSPTYMRASDLFTEQLVLLDGMHFGLPYGSSPYGSLGSLGSLGYTHSNSSSNLNYILNSNLTNPVKCAVDSFKDKLTRTDSLMGTINVPVTANIYLIPTTSSSHLTPEYDTAINLILKSDSNAYVLIGARVKTLAEDESPEHGLFINDLMQHKYPKVWTGFLKSRMRKVISSSSGSRSMDGGGNWRRVRFLDALSSEHYLLLLKASNVVLDTYPHCNLMSSIDALYVGTPVVTLGGSDPNSPNLVSAAHRTIEEWRTKQKTKNGNLPPINCCDHPSTEDEYVALAVKLGTNEAYRNEVSAMLMESSRALFREDSEFVEGEGGNGYLESVERFLVRVGRGVAKARREVRR